MENEATFIAPEGVYTVTEEHKPSIFQPITIGPPAPFFPTRVSCVVVRYPQLTKQGATAGLAQLLGGGNKDGRKDKAGKEKDKEKDRDDGVSLSSSDTPDEGETTAVGTTTDASTAVHPEQHTLFSQSSGGKKKGQGRPKHNIKTTSSTFITRVHSTDANLRALSSKQGDITFLFFNTGKNFVWLEAASKVKEPLARVTFAANPTCHDVNLTTAAPDHLDVIIGFNTGDLIWLDPISSRYGRLNKQGCITNSPCTSVRWVPSSATLFLVSHADGTIVVYDKERGDGVFTPQDPNTAPQPSLSDPSPSTSDSDPPASWDPHDNIFVTMPPWHPVASGTGKPDKDKAVKNPVSHWRVSKRSIVDFVFSPDVKYVGAISEDGCLRVIDALAEQLIDCYASYFGSLTCVAWSPDGRFILTGGQDDLLTLFSPWEQRVLARCQGHSSFVSAVSFDELRCDGRTYRFGSVGEDNKLILWDFSSGALHRPKLQATHHQRMSMSSTISLGFRRSALYLPSLNSPGGQVKPRYHPAPSRNEIAIVQPILIKQLENDLPTAISFLPRSILTSSKTGHIKLWIRPLALKQRHKGGKGLGIGLDGHVDS